MLHPYYMLMSDGFLFIFCIIPTRIIWKSDRLTYSSSEVEERSSYNWITKKFWLSDGRYGLIIMLQI